MTDKKFLKAFLARVEKTLLLDEADKKYWLENSANLPDTMVKYFSAILDEKDKVVDAYLEKALTDNPALVETMKSKVQKLRKDILALEENEADNKGSLEEMMNEELKKA